MGWGGVLQYDPKKNNIENWWGQCEPVRVIGDIREFITSRGSSSATMIRHRSVEGGDGTDYAIEANDRRRSGRSI